MMKSRKNIIIIFVIFIMLISQLLTSTTYAIGKSSSEEKNISLQITKLGKGSNNTNGGKNNKPTNNTDLLENLEDFRPSEITNEEAIMNKAGVILGAINFVGSIISVITIMIIGFKYMIGSAEDKASYKKTMIPWLIGAILVFTVSTVPNILYNIGLELL